MSDSSIQGQQPSPDFSVNKALSDQEEAQLGDAVHGATRATAAQAKGDAAAKDQVVVADQQAAKAPPGAKGPNAPQLPAPGSETVPTAENTGNAWLAPSYLVDFLEKMSDYLKEKQGERLQEGQLKVKGMEMTDALGAEKAAEILSKGLKEMAKHLISAAINIGSAGMGVRNLGQRAKLAKQQKQVGKEVGKEPTAGMSQTDKKAYDAQQPTVSRLEAKQQANAAAGNKNAAGEGKLTDKEHAELAKAKGKQKELTDKVEHQQSREIQTKLDGLHAESQVVNQFAQGLTGLNEAFMGMLVTLDEKELAEIETESDINRQFTQSAGEAGRSVADDIGAAIAAMQKAQEGQTQSFRFTQAA